MLGAGLGVLVEVSKRRAVVLRQPLEVKDRLPLGAKGAEHLGFGASGHAAQHDVRTRRGQHLVEGCTAGLVPPFASRRGDVGRADEPIHAAGTHAAAPTVDEKRLSALLPLKQRTGSGGHRLKFGAHKAEALVDGLRFADLLVQRPYGCALLVGEERKRHRSRQVPLRELPRTSHVQDDTVARRSQKRVRRQELFRDRHDHKDAT